MKYVIIFILTFLIVVNSYSYDTSRYTISGDAFSDVIRKDLFPHNLEYFNCDSGNYALLTSEITSDAAKYLIAFIIPVKQRGETNWDDSESKTEPKIIIFNSETGYTEMYGAYKGRTEIIRINQGYCQGSISGDFRMHVSGTSYKYLSVHGCTFLASRGKSDICSGNPEINIPLGKNKEFVNKIETIFQSVMVRHNG